VMTKVRAIGVMVFISVFAINYALVQIALS
jgi:hypothetical protein